MNDGVLGRARSVLVVSGRRLIAEAIQELLRAQRKVEDGVVAWNIDQLGDAVRACCPSTVIVDLDEPGCGAGELAEAIEVSPHARRIGVFDVFTVSHAQLAFDLGLTVLLPLTSTLEHLLGSILADGGRTAATPTVGLTRRQLARLHSLTPRELEVLNHIARGRSVKAIAGLLGITTHTVATHQRRCFAKLGVQRRAHAVALAASAGLISSD